MGTVLIDGKLDVGKVDDVEIDGSGICGDDLRKVHYLLLCSFGGIRRCVEIDRIERYAALGDHIARNGRIDASGKKEHSLAVCTNGHSAGAGNGFRVDISLVAELYVKEDVGLSDIDLERRKSIQYGFPEICRNLHGIEGVSLVSSSAYDLEGLTGIAVHIAPVFDGLLTELLLALGLVHYDRADVDDPEDVLEFFDDFVEIKGSSAFILGALQIDPSGRFPCEEFTGNCLHCGVYVSDKGILEKIPVIALDAYFRVFDQECVEYLFVHVRHYNTVLPIHIKKKACFMRAT